MKPLFRQPLEDVEEPTVTPEESPQNVKPGPGPALGAAAPYAEEEAREVALGLGKDNYHDVLDKES